MTSVSLGLLAAVAWAVSALFLTRAARARSAFEASVLFFAVQVVVLALPATVVIVRGEVDEGAWILLIAGCAEAVAIAAYSRALATTAVGLVTAVASLEGAVAAILIVLSGEPVTIGIAVGLAIASLGGALVALGGAEAGGGRGFGYAFLAALGMGSCLWLIHQAEVNFLFAMFTVNLIAGLVVATTGPWRRMLSHSPGGRGDGISIVTSSLTSLAGFGLYSLGADAGSAAVAAVLSAQFATLSTVGGFIWFRERLSAVSLGGIAVLLTGVSLIAIELG